MNLLNTIRDLVSRYLAGKLTLSTLAFEVAAYDQAALDAALWGGDAAPQQLLSNVQCPIWEWSDGYRTEESVREALAAVVEALPNVVTYSEIVYPPGPHGRTLATPTMHVHSVRSTTTWYLQKDGA